MTYPSDQYQPSGGYPPEPPRSPWSSPIVLVAAAAGVLLVIAGVLAAVLLIPTSTPSDRATSAPSTTLITTGNSTITITQQQATAPLPPTVPTVATPTSTTSTAETTHDTPTVSGTDWQGFTDGPRCNASNDPAVAIGITERSRIVICQVGDSGGLYYKGTAPEGGVEIQNPVRTGSTFTVTNKGYTYIVSPSTLTIEYGGSVLKVEDMQSYWSN